jgi:hypothetical protein
MVGRQEYDRLRAFLAAARSLFLMLGVVIAGSFLVLSPWLPGWFHFQAVPGTGSLTLLFACGATSLFLLIIGGYFHNVNAAYGTVAWPILPGLVLAQGGMLAHFLLARAGAPLWAQYLSYAGVQLGNIVAVWCMLRVAHGWLGELWPLRFDKYWWGELLGTSGWTYLWSLGSTVLVVTDRLLVNAGFGPDALTPYGLNYKPCEILLQVVLVAGFVSSPKLNQWIANGSAEARGRAQAESQRLNLFQALLGSAGALGYLACNHEFLRLWIRHAVEGGVEVPGGVMQAFALTMGVTASGNAGIMIAGMCGRKGLRTAGMTVAAGGLLNVGLAFTAVGYHWLPGIAWATVVAQSALNLVLARYTCRHLGLSFGRWAVRSWVAPVLTILAGEGLEWWLGSRGWAQALRLLGLYAPLLVVQAWASGMTPGMLAEELKVFRRLLPGKRN